MTYYPTTDPPLRSPARVICPYCSLRSFATVIRWQRPSPTEPGHSQAIARLECGHHVTTDPPTPPEHQEPT